NGCSPSSGNPVRLQPKSLFGFAEIRTVYAESSREQASTVPFGSGENESGDSTKYVELQGE
ncbi:hypothetical protein, partial [Burkholderia vietnamiensis]|uniref:hypothetical protein n=1 Tax=Burkholderia vietnamiensis TaxID=60552 RepID=UPI001E55FA0D